MIDLKPTTGRLREHWRYGWWKYVLFTVLALVGANMLFTVTTPKVPYEKRTEVIVLNDYSSDEVVKAWEEQLKQVVSADQKEVDIQVTMMMEGQEMTMMQLMAARMAGHEGTIMLLPQSMFQGMAASGGFIDLKDVLPQLKVPDGTDLTKGQVMVGADPQSGEKGTLQQSGIPLDQCKGLSELFINTDMVLCLPVYATGNWDNAVKTANWFLSKTEAPAVAGGATAQPQASAAN